MGLYYVCSSRTPYGKHSTFHTHQQLDQMEWMKWQWIQTHANYMPHEISTLLSVLWDKEATRNESGDSTRISSQDLLNTSLTTKALWPLGSGPEDKTTSTWSIYLIQIQLTHCLLCLIPVAWYRYDTYTRCHIHHLSPPVNNLTNWANTNWAVSQVSVGIPTDTNVKASWMKLNIFNFNTFIRTSSCLEVVGELTGKMH